MVAPAIILGGPLCLSVRDEREFDLTSARSAHLGEGLVEVLRDANGMRVLAYVHQELLCLGHHLCGGPWSVPRVFGKEGEQKRLKRNGDVVSFVSDIRRRFVNDSARALYILAPVESVAREQLVDDHPQ